MSTLAHLSGSCSGCCRELQASMLEVHPETKSWHLTPRYVGKRGRVRDVGSNPYPRAPSKCIMLTFGAYSI